MHDSAFQSMRQRVDRYVPTGVPLTVVDLGSRSVANQVKTHRSLFDERWCEYIGVDINEGPNVDVVMKQPYRIPLKDNSADVVVSGQVFEHIPYVWVSMLEIARILRPGGWCLLSAPSRGHEHNPPFDCWRFYPDSYRALAKFSTLQLLDVTTDLPPLTEKNRFDYAGIEASSYWGDTVGVFQKTPVYEAKRIKKIREPMIEWANNHADISRAGSDMAAPQPSLDWRTTAKARVRETRVGAKLAHWRRALRR